MHINLTDTFIKKVCEYHRPLTYKNPAIIGELYYFFFAHAFFAHAFFAHGFFTTVFFATTFFATGFFATSYFAAGVFATTFFAAVFATAFFAAGFATGFAATFAAAFLLNKKAILLSYICFEDRTNFFVLTLYFICNIFFSKEESDIFSYEYNFLNPFSIFLMYSTSLSRQYFGSRIMRRKSESDKFCVSFLSVFTSGSIDCIILYTL